MCGYCTSSHFLNKFVSEKTELEKTFNREHDGLFATNLSNYLLECKRTDLLKLSHTLLLDPWFATCAYLRAGEFLVKGKHSYSEVLNSILDKNNVPLVTNSESIDDIVKSIGITHPQIKSFKKLYVPQTYLNASAWKEFIGNTNDWFEFSCGLLDHYYNWWLKGENLINNNLNGKMNETDIFDHNEVIPQDQRNQFFELLPLISHAVNVVGTLQPRNKSLKRVAFNYPYGVPEFSALDIWIMRKALKYCFHYSSIKELENHSHPESCIYLEYAASQQNKMIIT